MDTYILQTNHLCKNFKSQHAVSDILLSIARNSVYGLLGPNGAGKSTTLKMITGMLRPTSGKIIFEGHPRSRGDLADIGALIESPPLYENLTAKENLKVRTLLLGLPDSRIHEVLETVSLTDTGNKRAGQFSMGMAPVNNNEKAGHMAKSAPFRIRTYQIPLRFKLTRNTGLQPAGNRYKSK